uniref:CUB domain-containing protein n=1 Tax=Macrostomum lignano TaxID=282301 RepID=A0A1I8GTH9_9PLAT
MCFRTGLKKATIISFLLMVSYLDQIAGCSDEHEYSSYGSMECPAWWSTYSNYENVKWIIQVQGVVSITFSRFSTQSYHDKVSIYERSTHFFYSNRESFRLSGSGSDVLYSEYFLTGPVFAHFTSDGSYTYSGIKLHYSRRSYISSISASTELIKQSSGWRTSHPNFGGGVQYPNNFKVAKSIYCQYGYFVRIHFSEFDTEEDKDVLKISY